MKKSAIVTLLCSSPAMAHMAKPETEFFQKQVFENPETLAILDYCHLVGLSNEDQCKAAFYKGDSINSVSLQAAKICVDKSGLRYRVAFDKVFGKNEKNGWVSHQDPHIGKYYHTYYLVDPAVDGKNGPAHRHVWGTYEKQLAGEEFGNEAVRKLKENWEQTSKTGETKASASSTVNSEVSVAAAKVTVEGTAGVEKSKSQTSTGPSQDQINQTYMSGYVQGYKHPEFSSVVPATYCLEKASCFGPDGVTSNNDGDVRVSSKVERDEPIKIKMPDGKFHDTPKAPSETKDVPKVDDGTKNFFSPIPSSVSTGGAAIQEKEKIVSNGVKGVQTPVTSENFVREMDDCLSREEKAIYEDIGSKTVDPNARSDADALAEAEQQLRDGYCNEKYWGAEKCFLFQHDLESTKVKSEQDRENEYETAIARFKQDGSCDSRILGEAFCSAAAYSLEITPVDAAVSPVPESDSNPPTSLPEHISVDEGHSSGNPSEGTPSD